jgi:hypothetical protein
MSDTHRELRAFQEAWNGYVRRRALHLPRLTLDGREGPKTHKAIKLSRYYVGVGTEDWEKNSPDVSDRLLRLLRHPFRRPAWETKKENQKRRKLASRRCAARVKEWKRSRRPPPSQNGLTILDGKQCAAWIAKALLRCRTNRGAAGRWPGYLISGFRDPLYSEQLCFRRCGRPSCPGTCAGRASNHSGIIYPRGAADCFLATLLRRVAASLGIPLINHLPYDEPHSSATGY